jgi:hypothetical protein
MPDSAECSKPRFIFLAEILGFYYRNEQRNTIIENTIIRRQEA